MGGTTLGRPLTLSRSRCLSWGAVRTEFSLEVYEWSPPPLMRNGESSLRRSMVENLLCSGPQSLPPPVSEALWFCAPSPKPTPFICLRL